MDEGRIARRRRARFGEQDLLAALAEDEARQGRPHTPREREAFAQGFFGEEYREELAEILAQGVVDDGDAS